MRKFFTILTIFLVANFLFSQNGWNIQSSGTNQPLKDIKFFDNNNGISAGGDVFIKTSNAGLNWTQYVTDTLVKGINSFSFISPAKGWCIAQSGIIKTTNGGTTWIKQEPYTSGANNKIFFNDSINGWAVGNSGVILSTTNGGNNWISQSSGTNEDINSVHFISSDSGWVVGNNSTILATTDGGNNWVTQSAGSINGKLFDVSFINRFVGWISGENGIILKTTDSGNNWIQQYGDTYDDLYFIFALDSSRAWAGGDYATITGTKNGGSNWSLQASSVGYPLYDIYFQTERLGWSSGLNGTLINSLSSGEFIRADFYADTLRGIKPFTVNFTENSSGNPTQFRWNFGDGSTSTFKNPSHTYTTHGTFPVILSITSGTYTSVNQKENYIFVDDILNADFTATPTEGSATLTVDFHDITTSQPTTWLWDFGDGSSSTMQNPSHNYEHQGVYNVTLTVGNYQGIDSTKKSNFIIVNEPLYSEFYGVPRSGPRPLVVNFYDDSPGKPNSWQWDFGDGLSSTLQNPTHSYQNSGTYTVNLIVSDGMHTDSEEKIAYIRVTDALKADFLASPTQGNLPLNVSFVDQSFGGATEWGWDFGDGRSSNEQNPVHNYLIPGKFTVRLSITDGLNTDVIEKIEYITVTGTPILEAEFSGTPRTGTEPISVQFTDLTTGGVLKRYWDFGDGGKSEERNPRYTFQNDGIYTVSLIVDNGLNQDTAIKENYIIVNPKQSDDVTADFSADIKVGNKPLTVTFTNKSIGNPTEFDWDFGDGSSSIFKDPTHQYFNSGTFTINLTVRKNDKQDTETKFNYIWVQEPISVENNINEFIKIETYPNPFEDMTNISFNINDNDLVVLEIFDLFGNKVDEIINKQLEAGFYNYIFSPGNSKINNLHSGLYFYKLNIIGNSTSVVKTGEIIYIK